MCVNPIYVEVSPLLAGHFTGIGRFAARLVEGLARHRPLRLITTIQGEHAQNMGLSSALGCGMEIEVNRADPALDVCDADVQGWARRLFQGPQRRHDSRLARDCAVVYTMLRPGQRHFRRELGLLYDFTPLLMPDQHVPETRLHMGTFFTHNAALCDKLVAISCSTKADAAWLCARPAEDVVTCYPGPSLCVRAHAHAQPVRRRQDVILVVSTLEPRKNGPFLFHWFRQTEALPVDTELWWVGPCGWLHEGWTPGKLRRGWNKLRRGVTAAGRFALGPWKGRSGSGRRIRFLGVISDRRLCELYQQAAFTVYPSLYEGFGFPVLDSLRHKTPVVCSYNSSLQEFSGPGVHFFDACDPASLDTACREVQSAPLPAAPCDDLERRFSWDRMAREVIALCE
jgi:glycosyltransferase involved in cell wall biosynthesis